MPDAIAWAYVRLASFKRTADARAWLLEPCEMLQNRRPIDLLRTRLGTEYFSTAISRMRPAPTFTQCVEEDETGEDEETFS